MITVTNNCNVIKSSKTNRKRTHNYNKNKLHQKLRLGTVSNKLLRGGGGGAGFNRFHARATLALGSAIVHKHTLKIVRFV